MGMRTYKHPQRRNIQFLWVLCLLCACALMIAYDGYAAPQEHEETQKDLRSLFDSANRNRKHYTSFPNNPEGGLTMALWGFTQMYPHREGRLLRDYEASEIRLVRHSQYENELPIRVALQTNSITGTAQRAPLVFSFEGFRADTEGWYSYDNMERMLRRGYHVVVLPSPFGEKSILAKPKKLPGSPVMEAKNHLETMKRALETIDPKIVSSVHVLGLSYGSLLGAIAAALDAESPRPIITGHVLLVAPAQNGRDPYIRADQKFDELADQLSSVQGLAVVGNFLNLLNAKSYHDISKQTLQKVPAISYVVGGQQEIVKIAQNIIKVKPNFKPSASSKNYRFWNYFKDFLQQDLKKMDASDSEVSTWIERILRKKKSIFVVSSDDDPHYPIEFHHSLVIRMHSTAHAGFRFIPLYDDILDTVYGFERPISEKKYADSVEAEHAEDRSDLLSRLELLSDAQKYISLLSHDVSKERNWLQKSAPQHRNLSLAQKKLSSAERALEINNCYLVKRIDAFFEQNPSFVQTDRWFDGGIGHHVRRIERYRQESLLKRSHCFDS